MSEAYISEYAVFSARAHLLREDAPQKTLCGKKTYLAMKRHNEPVCRLCKRIANKIDTVVLKEKESNE